MRSNRELVGAGKNVDIANSGFPAGLRSMSEKKLSDRAGHQGGPSQKVKMASQILLEVARAESNYLTCCVASFSKRRGVYRQAFCELDTVMLIHS